MNPEESSVVETSTIGMAGEESRLDVESDGGFSIEEGALLTEEEIREVMMGNTEQNNTIVEFDSQIKVL